jgi:hypothetical protein
MGMAEADDIRKSVGAASLGFGAVATLAPRLFLGTYGVPADQNVRLMTRLWGTRTAALGALALTLVDADDRRTMMTAAVAMNTVDTVLIVAAPVPRRARVMGMLTTAGFAAALAYGVSR